VLPLLMEIADALVDSRDLAARELTELSQNIEHIKQIVAVQQDYAKAGGVNQTFDPTELLADALRITHASLTRHGVTFTTDCPSAGLSLCTDRHLVLQIMVNLLNNAIQALKPRPAGQRRLRLQVAAADGLVRFSVEDNGIGIAPENRHRIFQHGFTTRKDGHGFGLHSGALAAKNLGGSLQAVSPGLNQGARFILELPLTPPAAKT
jgi:signal transduction histidine kinase